MEEQALFILLLKMKTPTQHFEKFLSLFPLGSALQLSLWSCCHFFFCSWRQHTSFCFQGFWLQINKRKQTESDPQWVDYKGFKISQNTYREFLVYVSRLFLRCWMNDDKSHQVDSFLLTICSLGDLKRLLSQHWSPLQRDRWWLTFLWAASLSEPSQYSLLLTSPCKKASP